jgi:oxygen-dependent protoporphyrinogen oxidase
VGSADRLSLATHEEPARPSAAIVGAGLCGLTAAHRLAQAGWRVVVFEATDAVGGRVQTFRSGGYQVDVGASAFPGAYKPYLALVNELGLEYRPVSPYVAIPRGGREHLLNMDRMVRSGLRTRLLSPSAKLRVGRLALDVARAKRRGRLGYSDMRKAAPLDTETARAYALRRLTPEIDRYLCEPIVRTMLIVDTDKVSKVDLFSGVANFFATPIYAIQGGQGRVCEKLAAPLDVRLGSPVERVVPAGTGVEVAHRDASGTATSERYDAAVVTAPLPVAARICPDHAGLLAPLSEILGYTQCLKVAIGTSARPRTPAFLVQFPSNEDADVALLFLDHNKCPDRAPAGHALIDACWETDAAERMMDASDEAIIEHTLQTILRLYPELAGTVDFAHVTRWRQALPLTSLGGYRKIGDFNAALDPSAPIQFAADYMSAPGQNTAVALGNRAAENLRRRGATLGARERAVDLGGPR